MVYAIYYVQGIWGNYWNIRRYLKIAFIPDMKEFLVWGVGYFYSFVIV